MQASVVGARERELLHVSIGEARVLPGGVQHAATVDCEGRDLRRASDHRSGVAARGIAGRESPRLRPVHAAVGRALDQHPCGLGGGGDAVSNPGGEEVEATVSRIDEDLAVLGPGARSAAEDELRRAPRLATVVCDGQKLVALRRRRFGSVVVGPHDVGRTRVERVGRDGFLVGNRVRFDDRRRRPAHPPVRRADDRYDIREGCCVDPAIGPDRDPGVARKRRLTRGRPGAARDLKRPAPPSASPVRADGRDDPPRAAAVVPVLLIDGDEPLRVSRIGRQRRLDLRVHVARRGSAIPERRVA